MAVTTSASNAVSFEALKGFPKLFRTYCHDYPRLDEFYAGDFRDASVRGQVAARRAASPANREKLANVLLDQNKRWGLDKLTRKHIERLRAEDSVAVVTGQQVGLMGGPLYTIFKTITALQLAQQMEAETGRPAVPVFWMAGEDHDYEEIAKIQLIKRNRPYTVQYTEHEHVDGQGRGPVGRLVTGEGIERFINTVEARLLDTEFKPALLEQLRKAYQPGTTLTDAFGQLLNGLFPESGLVLISPDDPELKRLAAPLWRKELEDYRTAETRLQKVTARLKKDYHAQIYPRATNLFMLEPEGRFSLVPDEENGQFKLKGLGRTYAQKELLDLVDQEPERFSPNVALRPLMQDYLFPTTAYVAGPGETSYFAQLKPLYEWADIPMPLIYPRASATVVESKVRKVLDRYELELADIQQDFEVLFKQVVLEWGDVDVQAEYKEASTYLHQAINYIKPIATEVDKTLVSSAEATRTALMQEMAKLKDKMIRAEKRNHEEIRNQLKKAQVGLFPERKLQERSLSVLYFLNKYSPAVLQQWQKQLSTDTTAHQVIDL